MSSPTAPAPTRRQLILADGSTYDLPAQPPAARHTLIDVPGAGPSICIDAGIKHTYPIAYFRRLAEGESVQMLPFDVLRVIVREWLQSLGVSV